MKKIFASILGLMLTFSTSTAFAQSARVYSDVPDSHVYSQAIQKISQQGIVSGYDNGTFKPDNFINRAEFLRIIDESFVDQEEFNGFTKGCFQDVPGDNWFTKYICYSKNAGHIEGYQDGRFHPENEVTLVEALKMVMEVVDVEEYAEKKAQMTGEGPWFEAILSSAIEENFVPTDFSYPHQRVTRGQMAEIIVRIQNHELGVDQLEKNEILQLSSGHDFDPLQAAKILQLPKEVQLDVPFTSQAPYHNWSAPYDEACEEASVIMVKHYLSGQAITTEEAKTEILSLTSWVEGRGFAVDIGTEEIAYAAQNFYGASSKIYSGEDVTSENIKRLLATGHPIIVPVAGQHIGNKHYAYPGPPYHVIVITGYDQDHFYANDPGTQFGYKYTYSQELLTQGIHDWNGSKSTVLDGAKAMIVLGGML